MPNHRIYADFNGLQNSSRTAGKLALYLHYYGSLMDLSRLKVRLHDGLQLDVYSDSDKNEDLEATGVVLFDNITERWFVEFDRSDIRYVPNHDGPSGTVFPCWNCGSELREQITLKGFDREHPCPNCGRKIDEPLKAP